MYNAAKQVRYRTLIDEQLIDPLHSAKTLRDLRRLSLRALNLYERMERDKVPQDDPERQRLTYFLERNLRVTAQISNSYT